MNKKRSMKRFKYRSLAWAIVGFACLEASVGNLNAALLWNFVSTDGTDTLTGTLTTDGQYSQTQSGTGLAEFTVTSYESFFLNGTDVTDNSIFGAIDPTFPSLADGYGGMVNMIRWSPTLQAIDPVSGLSGSGGIISGEQNVLRAVSPFQEPEGHVNVVFIGQPGHGSDSQTAVIQPFYTSEFLPDGFATFTPTSTVFTPVPEPRTYVWGAAAGLFILVWHRRKHSSESLVSM